MTIKELCISKIHHFELCHHSLLSRCPESLVVQGVAKSRVIVETGVQTVGGGEGEGGKGEGGYGQGDREGEEEGERRPNGLKEYILSHREEVTTFHPNLFLVVFSAVTHLQSVLKVKIPRVLFLNCSRSKTLILMMMVTITETATA